MSGYAEFLKRKAFTTPAVGLDVPDSAIHPSLFPFQRDVTRWAVRKGRAAIFADTGLGKTFMQLEWARLLGQRTLILAEIGNHAEFLGLLTRGEMLASFFIHDAKSSAHAGWRNWRMLLGDSVERLKEVADESVHLSVFSPPFLSLYTYTGTERDLGNSRTSHEFFEHFKFIIDDLFRATMPGRLCAVHVSQVPARLAYDGYMGIKDFRGDVIRAFEREKWIYHGEVCIDKDPQVQAVRSHAKQLLFVQLYKDSSWSVPAYADYILIFRKPGDNPVPVVPDLSRESWIEWARPVWYGVRQSETLNAAEGREENDERHVAALQLGVIERCVRLWTNPGELVLSPFAGIGSEGYMAVKLGRRFVGIELKRSYFEAACKNLRRAGVSDQVSLFAVTEGRIPMGER